MQMSMDGRCQTNGGLESEMQARPTETILLIFTHFYFEGYI